MVCRHNLPLVNYLCRYTKAQFTITPSVKAFFTPPTLGGFNCNNKIAKIHYLYQ